MGLPRGLVFVIQQIRRTSCQVIQWKLLTPWKPGKSLGKHDHRFHMISYKYLRKVFRCWPYYYSKCHVRESAFYCKESKLESCQRPADTKKEIKKIQEMQEFNSVKESFLVLPQLASCFIVLSEPVTVGTKNEFYMYGVQISNSQTQLGFGIR